MTEERTESKHRSAPTPQMISFADRLAGELGETLPDEARSSFDDCRKWLDDAAARVPATEKQVEFAQGIANETGKRIPPNVLASKYLLSRWIDENKP